MATELEKFIKNNREALDKEKPHPAVLNRVLEQMQAKGKMQQPKGIVIPFSVVRWAAASVILVAVGATVWLLLNPPKTVTPAPVAVNISRQIEAKAAGTAAALPTVIKVVKHQAVAQVDEDMLLRRRQLLAKMKKKQIIFAGLNNMDSPASRIIAATEACNLKNTDHDVVDALVQTLNNDPSPNVRLAALDGLARFYRETYVRKKLVAALKKQQEPVVQIALIELLTRMKASGILSDLEKLAGDENNMKAVRDCAYSGIFRLQSS